MGRDYPAGYQFFRERAHRAFMKNKDLEDPEAIEKLLKLGDYIVNELKAMYSLRKYRTMKQRYYDDQNDDLLTKKLEKLVKESQGQQSQSTSPPTKPD
jgi:metal-dependent amidase/aminoacylase/carboxypeptidase family protein